MGVVLRPHGVHGHLLLKVLTEFPERLTLAETVYLGDGRQAYTLQSARWHGQEMRIELAEVQDLDQADVLRGQMVVVHLADSADLPPGRYFYHQIEGLEVVTESGQSLGRIAEILETGANDVYVVRGGEREILLPAIESVIREIDLEHGRMVVHLLEGL